MSRWPRILIGLGIVAVVGVAAVRLVTTLMPAPTLGLTEDGELQPCPDSDNCVSSAADDQRHAIEPLACHPDDLDRVVDRAVTTLDRTSLVTAADGYAHLEARSLVFGFVDDLELHATLGRIEVRSAARLGGDDWGVNRERVEALRASVRDICG